MDLSSQDHLFHPQQWRRAWSHLSYLAYRRAFPSREGSKVWLCWSMNCFGSMLQQVSTPLATPQQVSLSLTSMVLPSTSACPCMKWALTVMPPSAQMRLTLSKLESRRLSLTLKRMAYSKAEIICLRVVERLTPSRPPCTPVFQKGAYISPKEGQKKSASLLMSQNSFSSLYYVKKPALRAQLSVPPPHQTEHQKPYSMCLPCLCIIVVMKEGWITGILPMLASRKQPVPQVIFTSSWPSP